jgi:hypothetical protein
MARITVTVEGEAEEVRAALSALLGSASVDVASDEPSREPVIGEGRGTVQSPWTADDLAHLWEYLTPDAQRVLATIAQQPDGYPFSDLEVELATDMRTIGGNLSSVGHAMRRLYGAGASYLRPWPLSKDATMRRYRMDEDVAETIRRLSAETTQGD